MTDSKISTKIITCNITMFCSGKTFGLKVNRVRCGEDDGVYTCRAVNSFGRCEASCNLTITREYYHGCYRS